MTKVHCYHFHGNEVARPEDVGETLSLLDKDGFIWIDFIDPTHDDLSALQGPLGLHPLSIEDCLDDNQIPKIEEFPNYCFVLFNTFTYRDDELTVNEVDFFLGRKFLVTVRCDDTEDKRFFSGLPDAVQRALAECGKGPDMLMHVILDYVVDRKFAAVEDLQDEVASSEENALRNSDSFKPDGVLRVRQHLLHLRKSLFHEREILTRICRHDFPFITERALFSYRDIYDHLAKFFEFIEITRELVSNLMELYLALQNNRLTLAANQTNQVMKRLTLINTIFMPLTLLAGIGGMSEYSMMTGPEHWRFAYPAFLVGLAGIAVINVAYLRWIRWV